MTQPSVPESGPPVSGEAVAIASLVAVEAAFLAAVIAAYKAWLGKVAAAMFAVLPVDPNVIWSLVPDWNRAVTALMTDLARIAELGWNAAIRELDSPAIAFDITNPVLQSQLRRTRNFMINTPNEVYVMVIRALDRNAGDPVAQEAAVREVLDVTGTVNWPSRARTVAVTEVHRAYNFGSLAAAMNVGGGVRKTWNAKEDKATRPFHAAADGQSRPVSQAFDVGGEALMAPGDPDGSAWNVIQCRCELSYLRSPSAR